MSCGLLTVREAMALLKVSRWTLYNLMRSGQLTSVVVSKRCRRIPESALNDYLARLCEETLR
ncbi:helix-turn-helix domain-containing protein [Spongiactinospora sp. TRM90649]|uniref:helix-turn-helix domain-containing protein n=1 Tax=Spongiactinospora sp. TRM90649 TaxID=3031114 RepID=UPI0023F9BBDE|nr:helix-turn-helix domain-containing protein [Spongiactinospora sp. TRM90649]MDF5757628.1 helix-turn-helix domain-containing protein [Spongiactinospora sp. TRM90649]